VAGNAAGYVVVQPGTFVSVGTDAPEFDTVPTASAILVHAGTTANINIEGSAFVWVS
jgi:hypothetical protein